MPSTYKKIAINTLYDSLKNSQVQRADVCNFDKFSDKELEYIGEIYPYTLLALQCIYKDIEFDNVVKYELCCKDNVFSLKGEIVDKEFYLDSLSNLTIIPNDLVDKKNLSTYNKNAYLIFKINLMAFYDATLGSYNYHNVLLKLILVLFGTDCSERLNNATKGLDKACSSLWEILKLKRNTFNSLNELVDFIYGENEVTPELELALFDSYNTLWQLSDCNSSDEEYYAKIDITDLFSSFRNGFENSLSKRYLPVLKGNIKQKPERENDKAGYYYFLYLTYKRSICKLGENEQPEKNGDKKKTDFDLNDNNFLKDKSNVSIR